MDAQRSAAGEWRTRLEEVAARLQNETGIRLTHSEPARLIWQQTHSFSLLSIDTGGQLLRLRVAGPSWFHTKSPAKLEDFQELPRWVEHSARAAFGPEQISAMARVLGEFADLYLPWMTPKDTALLVTAVRSAYGSASSLVNLLDINNIKKQLPEKVLNVLHRIDVKRAEKILKLSDFAQAFPLARGTQRSFHFKMGPTNSGKTYGALEALAKADSGVYLAPLRLLAMEVRDKLVARGIPCNLLTGEERVFMEGSKHTACTVEMMNPERPVDVAVIDEIQMLLDRDRGWAWTGALVGVPAKDVFVCGSANVLPACLKVLTDLQEDVDVEHLTRKNPLTVIDSPVQASSSNKKGSKKNENDKGPIRLEPGDAVIAFSRKEALALSALYRSKGFSVATIYGALAPEVRRTESNRFASGEAQVLVATDAIGMGLNLPIRRVIFSKLSKFDGNDVRLLFPTEAQQIAGRAGRYGIHEEGQVTTFEPRELKDLSLLLSSPLKSYAGKLSVAPTISQIQAMSELLKSERMSVLLPLFANQVVARSSLFEAAALTEMIKLGSFVDEVIGSNSRGITLSDRFVLACAPVTLNKAEERSFFLKCLLSFCKEAKQGVESACPLDFFENRRQSLAIAELHTKNLATYAWLSFKFPEVFHEGDAVPGLRNKLSRYIEKELLRQKGWET